MDSDAKIRALEERLARRLPPDHPEYDAFYDATDEQLAVWIGLTPTATEDVE